MECQTKSLKQSKIAWAGILVALLGALQIVLMDFDMTKLQNPETMGSALIQIVIGVLIVYFRQTSTSVIMK